MLLEHTLFGVVDKVAMAVERIKTFEPEGGYHLAFSGGKDSVCVYYLAKEAGVRFQARYNHTTVDPPELVYFIREQFPDVQTVYPKESMWELIVRHKIPPTRRIRYCCADLKERRTGEETVSLTGVRWAESHKRRTGRGLLELNVYQKNRIVMLNDNEENRRMFETCSVKGRHVVNPIVDWADAEVWEYIKTRNLPYCKLYDCGFKRLGCISCPLSGGRHMRWELERYPKYRQAYLRAFDRMLAVRRSAGLHPCWRDSAEVMAWWLGEKTMRPKGAPE